MSTDETESSDETEQETKTEEAGNVIEAGGGPAERNVIVTGGSSGLGSAVCEGLIKSGAHVISLDQRDEGPARTIITDLADIDSATRAVRTAIEELQHLDAVVCCAGIDFPAPLEQIDPKRWKKVVEVNLIGTASVVQAALPALYERHGRVITVASTLGHRAVGDATAYCASKFGVVGFTRALTAETRGRIGVTLITPGGMSTSFFDDRDDQYKPGADAVLADPSEVAAAIIWCLERPAGIEVRELAIMSSVEGSWP